jgi:hypothetical protein
MLLGLGLVCRVFVEYCLVFCSLSLVLVFCLSCSYNFGVEKR